MSQSKVEIPSEERAATASHLKVEFPPEERATTAVSIWGVLLGSVLLTAGFFFLLYPLGYDGKPGSSKYFIRELMMGYSTISWERVVFQFTTFMMFALSVMVVVLKFNKLKRENKILETDIVPQNLNMRDVPALIKVHSEIMAHPQLHKRVSLMRMARILSMWINTGDMARTQAYAKQESEMDIYSSDATYKANRLYIWAMPLLGFVGTVYGVSYGIGGFAEFLKGKVTSEMIKVQVGGITEGLAVAFYCTLLGLVTAGIAAFPSLAAERKEEEVIGGVDEYVEDRLLSRMPSTNEGALPTDEIVAMRKGIDRMSGEKSMDAIVSAIREIKIDFPMDQLTKAIDEGFRRLPDPDGYERVFSRAIEAAHQAVRQKYDEFSHQYEARISDLGAAFASKLDGVAERFTAGTAGLSSQINNSTLQVAAKLDGHAQAVQATGAKQVEQIALAHQGYIAALGTLGAQETKKWELLVAEFRLLSEKLSSQFQASVAQLNQAAAQYGQRVDDSSKALALQMSRVVEIGARIDQLLNASRSMETAFVNLGAGKEFGETLGALRGHLESSDAALKQLAKPRTIVLQEKAVD